MLVRGTAETALCGSGRSGVVGGVQNTVDESVNGPDEPLWNLLVGRGVDGRVSGEGRQSNVRGRVDPRRGAPGRLGEPESQTAASCFLASLAWDVEKDLLAWLSVNDAVEAATHPETALSMVGGVILHLRVM